MRVSVGLLNHKDGGHHNATGRHDFHSLQNTFTNVAKLDLLLYCEAKHYNRDAGTARYAAAEALRDVLGAPYVIEIGHMDRGPMPPAIIYDPRVLVLRTWWRAGDPEIYRDQRNLAWFALADSHPTAAGRFVFGAWVDHWDPISGEDRMPDARRIGRRRGDLQPLPVIGGMDANGTASGKHMPQRDWPVAPVSKRYGKGMQDPLTGAWGPDTRAVDMLLGWWNEHTRAREDGYGYHAVAELAWRTDPSVPLLPTVNDGVDPGGGLLVDWLMVNPAMLPYVLPDTYQVHVPPPGTVPGSDHRLVTVDLDLPGCYRVTPSDLMRPPSS